MMDDGPSANQLTNTHGNKRYVIMNLYWKFLLKELLLLIV